MSADSAGTASAVQLWIRGLHKCLTRATLAKAMSVWALSQSVLAAQPPVAYPSAVPEVPTGMGSGLQLEDGSISGRVDAVHSPNIGRMLKPQFNLELERRHSQMIVTTRPVRRIAVTDRDIADYVQYSESEISVVGLELGKTDLTLWFAGEELPTIYEVTVIRDASLEEQRTLDFGRLERRLRDLFPNSQVALIPVGAQVLVRGQAYDSEEAQNILQIVRSEVLRSLGRLQDNDDLLGSNVLPLGGALAGGAGGFGGNNNNQLNGFRDIVINELSIPGEFNISMRVVVAELNRSELRNAGIDWRVIFNDGRHSVGADVGGSFGSTLSGIFENGEIQVFLRWLQSNGTVKLLAEPQLVCLSGTGASILAGGEFAVPTIIGLGGGQATSFRGFGTSLLVTPTVIDKDLIRLVVVPEFSELNADNTVEGIPGTNVKRVLTTVELREGQTFAIGGLISRQTLSEVSRIPLFGDIPLIGPVLFAGKKASEVETELLVLVSPEIVRPMEPDEVPPLPGFNHTHPADCELWKYGRTEGMPDNNVYQTPPLGTGSLHGTPQGYSLFNPAATHPGYPGSGQAMQGTVVHDGYSQYSGGLSPYNAPMQGSVTPQPDYSVPSQGGYAQPMVPPVPPQSAPSMPMQYGAPPVHPGSYSAPVYPQQTSMPVTSTPSVAAEKPSMLSRVGSALRRDQRAPEGRGTGNVRSAGWTRPAGQ
jgi:pilus assembly protein CpaC